MYWLIRQLLQPYPILILSALVALLVGYKRCWSSRKWFWAVATPTLALAVLSTPWAAYLCSITLESQSPLEVNHDGHEAIVVLAGALTGRDELHPEAELAPDSIARCLHGAKQYHAGARCPVLLCGGTVDPTVDAPPLAHLMRDFLIQLGIDPRDIHLEAESQTTYENALYCRKLLANLKIQRVTLVTDAMSMPRAKWCFEAQGIEVIPRACWRSSPPGFTFAAFWPDPGAAGTVQSAWHEWVGIVWYYLRGRI